MNSKKFLTDEEVELEISVLLEDPMVKLAKKDTRIKYRRRQYLYGLRNLKKKGEELAKAGITMEVLDAMDKECDSVKGEE